MFASATQVHEVDKATFKAKVPALREALLDAQFDLVAKQDFAVLILLAGIDGAGRSAALARLNEWLDPRHLHTVAFDSPDEGERARAPLWRFWINLPPRGRIGIFLGSWYKDLLREFVLRGDHPSRLDHEIAAIVRLERMLAAEDVLLIKLWLHISHDEHRKRLAEIKKLPGGGRHVLDYLQVEAHYERSLAIVEETLRVTSIGEAPWVVIPSANAAYRDLEVGQTVLTAISKRLATHAVAKGAAAPVLVANTDRKTALDAIDLTLSLDRASYKNQLARYQRHLARLTDDKRFRNVALIATFEGNDAAGKGGSIRRMTQAIDPRRFKVHSIAAPSDEERAHPYLWRFWKHIPRRGNVAIYDRTWYGRVLVERIEGFCSEADWQRAYCEINDFEQQLVDSGVVLVKFWLAISKDEQLRRFKERENTPYKRHKITDEDWRNREKWDGYAIAVGDMIDRTSTHYAPWTLVPSEDKRYARVMIVKTLCERLEAAL